MKLTKLATAALLVGWAFTSSAAVDTDKISEVINASMTRFDVPGMAVAIVRLH